MIYKQLLLTFIGKFSLLSWKKQDNFTESFKNLPISLTSLQNSYYHFCLFFLTLLYVNKYIYISTNIVTKYIHTFFNKYEHFYRTHINFVYVMETHRNEILLLLLGYKLELVILLLFSFCFLFFFFLAISLVFFLAILWVN